MECVVRGYITGSGWKDYQRSGEVCGIGLPDGLQESEQLPEPIFTPATKADVGDHDENVDFDRAAEILGDRAALEELRRISIELYARASAHARERGIILADTKFELGRNAAGDIVLGDEALTPDSSRFWPADGYEVGKGQPSFDKQYVRDWSSGSGWDKSPPAPELPAGSGGRHPPALPRGLREDHRRAVRRVAAPQRRRVVPRVRVLSGPRRGSSTRRARPWSVRSPRWASRAWPTCTWAGWSSWMPRTPPGCPRCASACWPTP